MRKHDVEEEREFRSVLDLKPLNGGGCCSHHRNGNGSIGQDRTSDWGVGGIYVFKMLTFRW